MRGYEPFYIRQPLSRKKNGGERRKQTLQCETMGFALRVILLLGFCSSHEHLSHAFQLDLLGTRHDVKNTNLFSHSTNHDSHNNDIEISRRKALSIASSVTSASLLWNPESSLAASEGIPIEAKWSASDGLNFESENKFVQFSTSSYLAMKNDQSRTPLFQKAIYNRLYYDENGKPQDPETQVVLDLGTGPYAIFAIIAAEAGAKKVYAIEADPQAAQLARQTIAKVGLNDIITIIEGYSSSITLPEKVDFVVAEIVGSIASEENAYATIRDAHKRFVKNPNSPNNWIPNRIQTYAAPASYTLHNIFTPPAYDWSKIRKEQPIRFNCRDEGLQLLSNPQLVEDFFFYNPDSSPSSSSGQNKKLEFITDSNRIQENEKAFEKEYKDGRLPPNEISDISRDTSQSFSGIAFWPRLIIQDAAMNFDQKQKEPILVNSRQYPDGGHQRSHWQTVLPIMTDLPVFQLKGNDRIEVTWEVTDPSSVKESPKYSISGNIYRA